MNDISEKRRPLTAREKQVLMLLATGHRDNEIAKFLSTGRETVKTHVRSIFTKLKARTRPMAVTQFLLENPRSFMEMLGRSAVLRPEFDSPTRVPRELCP